MPFKVENLGKKLLTVAMLNVVALLVSGLGTRMEWFHFTTGLAIFRWTATIGLVNAALSLLLTIVLLVMPQNRAMAKWAALSTILAAATYMPAHLFKAKVMSLPFIHDISTDTVSPPPFVKILELRKPDHNPSEYAGEEIASQQRQAYPDITPRYANMSASDAFSKVLAVATSFGWEVVDSDAAAGRIEATDTTLFFGFKDDVVFRLTQEGDAIRLDVRSLSRVGKSDVGANAERIRRIFNALPDFKDRD